MSNAAPSRTPMNTSEEVSFIARYGAVIEAQTGATMVVMEHPFDQMAVLASSASAQPWKMDWTTIHRLLANGSWSVVRYGVNHDPDRYEDEDDMVRRVSVG